MGQWMGLNWGVVRDRSAYSLTEVMIAAGLTTGVALGLAQIMQHANRSAKSVEASGDFASIASAIQFTLDDEQACKEAFGNIYLDPDDDNKDRNHKKNSGQGGNHRDKGGHEIRSLVVGKDAASQKTIVEKGGATAGGLRITSMEFTDVKRTIAPEGGYKDLHLSEDPVGTPPRHEYLVAFKIQGEKIIHGGESQVGLKKLESNFRFWVVTDKDTGQILRCYGKYKDATKENICETIGAQMNNDGTCSTICPPNARQLGAGTGCRCIGGAAFNLTNGKCECPKPRLSFEVAHPPIFGPSIGNEFNVRYDENLGCVCRENIIGLAKEGTVDKAVPYKYLDGGVAPDGTLSNSGGGLFCACPGFLKSVLSVTPANGGTTNPWDIAANWRNQVDPTAPYSKYLMQGLTSTGPGQFTCGCSAADQRSNGSSAQSSCVCELKDAVINPNSGSPKCDCKGNMLSDFDFLKKKSGTNSCQCLKDRPSSIASTWGDSSFFEKGEQTKCTCEEAGWNRDKAGQCRNCANERKAWDATAKDCKPCGNSPYDTSPERPSNLDDYYLFGFNINTGMCDFCPENQASKWDNNVGGWVCNTCMVHKGSGYGFVNDATNGRGCIRCAEKHLILQGDRCVSCPSGQIFYYACITRGLGPDDCTCSQARGTATEECYASNPPNGYCKACNEHWFIPLDPKGIKKDCVNCCTLTTTDQASCNKIPPPNGGTECISPSSAPPPTYSPPPTQTCSEEMCKNQCHIKCVAPKTRNWNTCGCDDPPARPKTCEENGSATCNNGQCFPTWPCPENTDPDKAACTCKQKPPPPRSPIDITCVTKSGVAGRLNGSCNVNVPVDGSDRYSCTLTAPSPPDSAVNCTNYVNGGLAGCQCTGALTANWGAAIDNKICKFHCQ